MKEIKYVQSFQTTQEVWSESSDCAAGIRAKKGGALGEVILFWAQHLCNVFVFVLLADIIYCL